MSLRGTNTEREVRRAEEEPDALVPLSARHVERGADAVHRDEAELPDRRRVGGAGHEDATETAERRLAGVPVPERQQRMNGAPSPVVGDGARVDRGWPPDVREDARLVSQPRRVEERAIRLLRWMREVPAEAVDEDCRPAVDDRERVAPEAKRKAKPEVGGRERVRPLAREEGRHAR